MTTLCIVISLLVLVVLVLVVTKYNSSSSMIGSGEGNKEIVLFYVSWCRHCKDLKPKWIEAKKSAKVKVREVECEADKEMCMKEGVKGYPTIMIYENGQKTTYTGPRDVASLIKLMS